MSKRRNDYCCELDRSNSSIDETNAADSNEVSSNKKVKLDESDKDGGHKSPEKSPQKSDSMMRTDYISWDDYFMAVAFLSAHRSKDPNSQVGACIVNAEKKIVGIGYNGMPNGIPDEALPWNRTGKTKLDTKYPYVCHAEMNAIMNKNSADIKGCTIYVALFPCNDCAKLIIQSGMIRVLYLSDKYHDKPEMVASRRLLDLAGVEYSQYEPVRRKIVIDFDVINQSLQADDDNDVLKSVASP